MNLEFKQVTKSYGIVNALDSVSFSVKSGDFVIIVGPSGAGKSTLVKLILQQVKPTSGQIEINNVSTSALSKKEVDNIRRSIGVIFQDYQLIPDKSVEENIILSLDINNFPVAQIPERVDQVLKMVNLETRKFLFPSQLSGGELQRTSLARALAINPKLILADEPTGNLDPENSWNLINLLLDINQNHGTTIIMTTHNFEIVNTLKKRVLTFDSGRLISDSEILPVVTKIKKKKKKYHDHT